MLNKKGFSLMELVMVCLMIGILTSIAVPKYRRAVDRARVGEAVTLIRSIYDSCERYGWENGPWTLNGSSSRSCAAAVSKGGATFKNIDITVKGTFSSDLKTLSTNNFDYKLTGSATKPVSAKYNKTNSPYYNAEVYLNGSTLDLICDATSASAGEGQKACDVWGSATWNQEGGSGYWK